MNSGFADAADWDGGGNAADADAADADMGTADAADAAADADMGTADAADANAADADMGAADANEDAAAAIFLYVLPPLCCPFICCLIKIFKPKVIIKCDYTPQSQV